MIIHKAKNETAKHTA